MKVLMIRKQKQKLGSNCALVDLDPGIITNPLKETIKVIKNHKKSFKRNQNPS
jgi:hypothetical protein